MSEREIAALLGEHEYALQLPRGAICTCGHVPTVDAASLKTQQDYHRHHLADLLAARDRRVRGEAWDQGVSAVCPNPDMCWCDGLDGEPNVIHEQPPINPYHADRIEADA